MSKSGKIFDVAVPVIVLANVVFYYLYNTYPSLAPALDTHFVASRAGIAEYRLWTLVSYAFFHKEFLHLFVSTFALITFGFMLENLVGSKFFFEYFLVTAAAGAVNHVMISPALHQEEATLFGSTAPLTGVMVLAALIYRGQTLKLLKVFPIKAMWGAALFLAADLMGLLMGSSPVGNGAHIGAAAVAVIYYHKILRHRVWRNLRAAGEGKPLAHVQVTKLGWIIPCKHEEEFDDMVVFLRDMVGLEIAEQGAPVVDTQVKRFTKFKTPHGSLKVVEPERTISGDIYTTPVLSITVDDLANACKNLDSRAVKMVAPVYHSTATWAIVFFRAPDGRIYQLQGPYNQA